MGKGDGEPVFVDDNNEHRIGSMLVAVSLFMAGKGKLCRM